MANVCIQGFSYTRTEFIGLTVVPPAITNAYFAKKVVTTQPAPASGLTVSFEPITEGILGREVYIIVETSDFMSIPDPTAKANLVLHLYAGNSTLTGTADDLLQLTDGNAAVDSFTAQVGDTSVLEDNEGTNPYTNLADFDNTAIFKIALRPHDRATFDTWAENIYNGIPQNNLGAIEIELEPEDCNMVLSPPLSQPTQVISDQKVRFQTNGAFTVQNKNVYEIYHRDNGFNFNPNFTDHDSINRRQPISRLANNSTDIVTYIYFDSNDNIHFICDTEKFTINGKHNGVGLSNSNVPNSYKRAIIVSEGIAAGTKTLATLTTQEQADLALITATEDFSIYGTEGVDSDTHYTFANGIISKGGTYSDRYYRNRTNNVDLVNAQIGANNVLERNVPDPSANLFDLYSGLDYVNGDVIVKYGFYKTRRRYVNPLFFAIVIGGIAQCSFNQVVSVGPTTYTGLLCQGFSYEDGTCFPSTSHVNGVAFDTNYLLTEALEDELTNGLRAYGVDYQLRGSSGWKPNIDHATYKKLHETHLHSGGNAISMEFINTLL